MSAYHRLFCLLCCVRFTLFQSTVWARDSNDEGWEFMVGAPYVWAVGVNGDITVKGQTSNVDVSFYRHH